MLTTVSEMTDITTRGMVMQERKGGCPYKRTAELMGWLYAYMMRQKYVCTGPRLRFPVHFKGHDRRYKKGKSRV